MTFRRFFQKNKKNQKNPNKILKDNISVLIKEISSLKDIIIKQNSIIEKINNENINIKDELKTIINSVNKINTNNLVNSNNSNKISSYSSSLSQSSSFILPKQPSVFLPSSQQPSVSQLPSAFLPTTQPTPSSTSQISGINSDPVTPTKNKFTFSKALQQSSKRQRIDPSNSSNISAKNSAPAKRTLKNQFI